MNPDEDLCWACGGEYTPLCHGEPPTQIDGQTDILEELAT